MTNPEPANPFAEFVSPNPDTVMAWCRQDSGTRARRWRKRLLLVAVLVPVAAAVVVCGTIWWRSVEARQEKERLQGIWGMIGDGRGHIVNPRDGVPGFTIEGDKFVSFLLKMEDGQIKKLPGTWPEATFTVDPSKSPKAIDVTIVTGPESGHTDRGIYDLKGDKLTMCFAVPNKDRPTAFRWVQDESYMFVLQRSGR